MKYRLEIPLAIVLATTATAACDRRVTPSEHGSNHQKMLDTAELVDPEAELKALFANETVQKLKDLLNSDYLECEDIRHLSFTVLSISRGESSLYRLKYVLHYKNGEQIEIETGSLELIHPDSNNPQVKEKNVQTVREAVRTMVQSFYNTFLYKYNRCVPNQTIGHTLDGKRTDPYPIILTNHR